MLRSNFELKSVNKSLSKETILRWNIIFSSTTEYVSQWCSRCPVHPGLSTVRQLLNYSLVC